MIKREQIAGAFALCATPLVMRASLGDRGQRDGRPAARARREDVDGADSVCGLRGRSAPFGADGGGAVWNALGAGGRERSRGVPRARGALDGSERRTVQGGSPSCGYECQWDQLGLKYASKHMRNLKIIAVICFV